MACMPTATDLRHRFFELHARPEVFVMPNPWDLGSARLLAHAGFEALATTSAGFALSLGRGDYRVERDEVVDHVAAITAAVAVPLNVDSERCFADTPDGVAETVRLLHAAGAAGCSIEDWDDAAGAFDPLAAAVERVAAAAEAAHRDPDDPLLLTARCEHFLHGITDLDATIERLVAYRDAGADCVYAPGLTTTEQIADVVDAVGIPVNVLAWRDGPSVAQIGAAGGRRVSVGSTLANVAYGALMSGARELLERGTTTFRSGALSAADHAALA